MSEMTTSATPATPVPPTPGGPITKADLQAKFEQIQTTVEGTVDEAKGASNRVLLIGGGILLLVFMYVLGRRSGKKRRTYVEIRRV